MLFVRSIPSSAVVLRCLLSFAFSFSCSTTTTSLFEFLVSSLARVNSHVYRIIWSFLRLSVFVCLPVNHRSPPSFSSPKPIATIPSFRSIYGSDRCLARLDTLSGWLHYFLRLLGFFIFIFFLFPQFSIKYLGTRVYCCNFIQFSCSIFWIFN